MRPRPRWRDEDNWEGGKKKKSEGINVKGESEPTGRDTV